eukprot:13123903-Alexandrium_andersonii.AAC.1
MACGVRATPHGRWPCTRHAPTALSHVTPAACAQKALTHATVHRTRRVHASRLIYIGPSQNV